MTVTSAFFSWRASDMLGLMRLGEFDLAVAGAGVVGLAHAAEGVRRGSPGPVRLASPLPGVRVVAVTTGIGMTTCHGLAAEVVAGLVS